MSTPERDELAEAFKRTAQLGRSAMRVDRTGWTTDQWIEDAEAIMDDIDGSAACLLNGHVLAMLRKIRELREQPTAASSRVP